MSKLKLLLTGFEPFGGRLSNNSLEISNCLSKSRAIGKAYDVTSLSIPVVRDAPYDHLTTAMESTVFDLILSLGESGRTGLSLEASAVNQRRYRIPDNMGNQPEGEAIAPNGQWRLTSTFPYYPLLTAAADEGVTAAISVNAGLFLCNELLYTALRAVRLRGLSTRVGFIHVPSGDDQRGDEDDLIVPMVTAIERGLLEIST